MLEITPITRIVVSMDVAGLLADKAPAVIAGVDVAFVEPGAAPVGTTAWMASTYSAGTAHVMVAGYDADPVDALVCPPGNGANLWILVTDAVTGEVIPKMVMRVEAKRGPSGAETVVSGTPFVTSVAGLTGIVSGPALITGLGTALTNAIDTEIGAHAVSSVNTRTGAVTLAKADVGLGNVDNTSDAAKPISTATQTALNAKANIADVETVHPAAADTVSLLGDSITANNQASNAFATSYNNDGYWTWTSLRLRGRLKLAGIFGYAGQTIAQITAHVTDALAVNPGRVVVLAGTNSVTAGLTLAQLQTDMRALLAPLLAAKVALTVGTVPPLTAWTAGQKQIAYAFNRWLLDYGYAHGITVVDWSSPLADPTTGLPLSGVLHSDGIHPNGIGAAKMGQRLAVALTPSVPATDIQSTGGDPNIIHTNPAMASGSPIATGWSLFDSSFGVSGARAGCVPTIVARTDDVPGNWQQFAVTDTSGTVFISPVMNVGTGFAVGDTVTGSVEFDRDDDWAGMGTTAAAFRVSIQCGGSGFVAYAANHIGGDVYPLTYLPLNGVIQIPPFVVPASTTTAKLVVEFMGQGTLRLGRTEMRKVVAP